MVVMAAEPSSLTCVRITSYTCCFILAILKFHLNFPLRLVTGATMMLVWRRSKHCTTPCKCPHCTKDMKMRATSGYRSSLQVTLRTFLTRSSTILPTRSIRGTSEGGNTAVIDGVRCTGLFPLWLWSWGTGDLLVLSKGVCQRTGLLVLEILQAFF